MTLKVVSMPRRGSSAGAVSGSNDLIRDLD